MDLDSINNICSLVEEIIELADEVSKEASKDEIDGSYIKRLQNFIKSKALTIKDKANRMEERLKLYRKGIEELGFKRVKKRVK
jgi:hypothetical protein